MLISKKTRQWVDDAACKGTDPEIFHPPLSDPAAAAYVLIKFCARCPVRAECEKDAIAYGDDRYGIRGNQQRKPHAEQPNPPWEPPVRDECGTERGPALHKTLREPRCTPCALAARSTY